MLVAVAYKKEAVNMRFLRRLGLFVSRAVIFSLGCAFFAAPAHSADLDVIETGQFVREAPPQKDSIRIICWNIERGYRLEEIIRLFKTKLQADVYILQEVDRGAKRTEYRNVAREIAEALEMNYAFAIEFEELKQGRGGEPAYHGQAILSRYPINPRLLRFKHQPHDWSRDPFQRRNGGRQALFAEIAVGENRVLIANTHLESRADDKNQARQAEEIVDYYRANYEVGGPVIVAGDLNTGSGFLPLRTTEVFYRAGFRDAFAGLFGEKRTSGNNRHDWVFSVGLAPLAAKVWRKFHFSDHDPLDVTLVFPHE